MKWFDWFKSLGNSRGRETLKEQVIGADPTRGYTSHQFFASEVLINDLPLFTLWQGRRMLRSDPVVSFAQNVRNAALMVADVEVVAANEAVKQWVEKQWATLWDKHRRQLVSAKRFGFAALQVQYKDEHGQLAIEGVKDFAPEDVRALEHAGKVVGFKVRGTGGSGVSYGEVKVKSPLACWLTFNGEYGSPYGQGCLRRAYPPWYEKWMNSGSKKLTQLRMMKDAWIGDQIIAPYNLLAEFPDGQGGTTKIPWKDVLRELIENRKSGGALVLPYLPNKDGTANMVEYVPPQGLPGTTDLFEWTEKLDEAIFMGHDVPMEIVKVDSGPGGFAGRSIPMMVVLSVCTEELTEIVQQVEQHILRPAAWLQFGGEPEFELKPKSLVESFASDAGGSAMGGEAVGGGQLGGQRPGQPPPSSQNGNRMGWVDGKGNVTQFDESDSRWITIGGRKEGDKDHVGGFPVQIDAGGNIVKSGGHQGLVGQHVNRVGEFFRGQRSQAAHEQEVADWGGRKGWNTIVARQSARWRIKPEQYEEIADQVWTERMKHHGEREAAKSYARRRLNLNRSQIESLENKGLDYGSEHKRIRGLDTLGREMAADFPSLGWGEGYDAGPENQIDYAEKLWELLKEGKQELPAKTSQAFHAAVDEHLGEQWEKRKKGESKKWNDDFEFGANQFDEGPAADLSAPPITATRRRILTAAERIAALKKNDLTFGTLASRIEAELRALRPGIAADLSASMFGGALQGMADAVSMLPPAVTAPDTFTVGLPPAPPSVPPLGGLLFPDGEPPGVTFPTVAQAIERIESSPVAATLDYRETAAQVREGAFAITGDLTDSAVADVRDILAETMRTGGSEADFVDIVVSRLEEEGGPLAEPHVAQIFRTNTATAASTAQDKALSAPMVVDAFPYRSYWATTDQRVRDEHMALERHGLDGTNIYRADDPTWQRFRPPWDFNCRCAWSPVTVLQASRAGVREAQEWWARAKAMADEQGGSPDEYLSRTAPPEPQLVIPPPFEPPPEFRR